MYTRKKPCNGCNEYVTSDFVMYTGESEGCSDTSNKTRLTDVLGKIISFIKKRIVRVTSSSLVVTNNSLNCDKGVKIELQPSVQPGNKLVLGSDGKPYVPNDSSTISELQDTELVFSKPITFEGQVSAEDIAVSGGIEAAFFMVSRNGLQTIVPVFRQDYSAGDTYYFNDFVSYQGKLWYYHNQTPMSGITPETGSYWTLIVDRGPQGPAGTAGADGVSPDYTEFRFAINQDPLSPPAVAYTNPNPTGWTKTPPTPEIGDVLWMIIGRKKGDTGAMIGQWVGPINTKGATGDPGNDGATGPAGPPGEQGAPGNDGTYGQNGQDGKDIELRYAKNGSATVPPPLNKTVAAPPGWTLEPPAVGDLEYIWVITGYKKAGALVGQWSNPVRFTGIAGKDGAQGVGSKNPYKQTVFKKTASENAPPSKPPNDAGTWTNPIPAGWSDGIPPGNGVIWTTYRWFTQDGSPPQQSEWSPVQMYGATVTGPGGETLTPVYMGSTVLVNPGRPDTVPANWKFLNCTGHDPSECMNEEDAIWIAVAHYNSAGFKVIDWILSLVKYETGGGGGGGAGEAPVPAPRGKLIPVFIRSATPPVTPVGGSYANPVPTGWSLNPPAGDAKLYMSLKWFTQDGVDETSWTVPVEMANTNSFMIKFSHYDTPGNPTSNPEKWHDPGVETGHSESVFDKWMATRTIQNGIDSGWTVVKFGGGGAGAGVAGPPGPALTFRGVWNPYVNNYYGGLTLSEIVEYPEYSNQYWRTRTDMGNQYVPVGTTPQPGVYWEPFAIFHESIATGLLFARAAFVKNLIVSYLRTGPSPARTELGVFIPGDPGSEHIEIYPGLSTLIEYRDRGDAGFTGLVGPNGDPNLHLRNLANSIIFYDRYDQGLRTKTEVDKVQLLKIHAIDSYTLPGSSYTGTTPEGQPFTVTLPGESLPGTAEIYMRSRLTPTTGIVYEAKISSSSIIYKREGLDKIILNGNNNLIKGSTTLDTVYATRFIGHMVNTGEPLFFTSLEGSWLAGGIWSNFRVPMASPITTIGLAAFDPPNAVRTVVHIINSAATGDLNVNLQTGTGNKIFTKSGNVGGYSFITISPKKAITLIPGPYGWYEA